MRYLVIAIAFLFVGCSSAKKNATPTPTETKTMAPATTEKAVMPTNPEKLSCAKEKETRVLEIVKKNGGCELSYTKEGKTSAVASSSHGTKHCEDSKAKIRTKLEKAGYQCS